MFSDRGSPTNPCLQNLSGTYTTQLLCRCKPGQFCGGDQGEKGPFLATIPDLRVGKINFAILKE